jgi:hydrogenase 3 maturation protease
MFSGVHNLTKGEYDLEKEIKEWLTNHGTVAVAGIGNPIRMDDFVGVKIVQDLQDKVPKKVCLIECETVPESFMQEIVDLKPTHMLLIDAAIIGLKPGDVRLVFPEQVEAFPAITTHVLPLRIFCEYITQATKTRIALLLVQPSSTEFGEGLTLQVQEAAAKIAETLLKCLVSKRRS